MWNTFRVSVKVEICEVRLVKLSSQYDMPTAVTSWAPEARQVGNCSSGPLQRPGISCPSLLGYMDHPRTRETSSTQFMSCIRAALTLLQDPVLVLQLNTEHSQSYSQRDICFWSAIHLSFNGGIWYRFTFLGCIAKLCHRPSKSSGRGKTLFCFYYFSLGQL
jgi:hypothetical protein